MAISSNQFKWCALKFINIQTSIVIWNLDRFDNKNSIEICGEVSLEMWWTLKKTNSKADLRSPWTSMESVFTSCVDRLFSFCCIFNVEIDSKTLHRANLCTFKLTNYLHKTLKLLSHINHCLSGCLSYLVPYLIGT